MIAISQQDADNPTSRLVTLRNGAEDAPLFLLPGGDGDPHRLAALASSMRNFRALIGVDFCRPDNRGRLPSTVKATADRSYYAIRALQPRGPYYIVGYSFGGLVAIEVARLLHEAGDKTALLGLIDTLYDQRFWPKRIFLRSQVHLIRRHLAILVHLPLNQMYRMLFSRSQRLLVRLLKRQMPSSRAISIPETVSATAIKPHCKAMKSNYRPRYYAGKITFFSAEDHDDYGCDPVELWQGMATEIECLTVSGTHVGVVTDGASLAELAAALDSKLEASLPARGSSSVSRRRLSQMDALRPPV
jgi:thioesterase domain-containing protein